MVTTQQIADSALTEWQRLRALPPKQRMIQVEAELRRYREIEAIIAREMADA